MRTRRDRCPGVLRPWPAADGGLARVRVPGGQLPVSSLRALIAVAERYGDGRVRLTGRANLQLRGLPLADGALPEEVVAAIASTGLLPSRSHDLARNILVSPCTGLAGGRADLRPVTAALDAALIAVPELAGLPGRFLFTLDDGRGDLAERHLDLGAVALDAVTAQLRVGASWGAVLPWTEVPAALVELARSFLDLRGDGADAAWHVTELAASAGTLARAEAADRRATVRTAPLPFGDVPGGRHHPVGPDAAIDAATTAAWSTAADLVVLTPFGGVLVPATDTEPPLEER